MDDGEFSRIRHFTSFFHALPKTPRGPGDDCAVLAPSPRAQCITTDAVVDGVHFTRATFSPEDIGHKALAVNLSDLAAMGAKPTWFVCALGLPSDFTRDELAGLARGMAALAEKSGISLVGGNVTGSPVLTVTLTVAGTVGKGGALLRSGGRPGDVLFVSGNLGGARTGFALLTGEAAAREPEASSPPIPARRAASSSALSKSAAASARLRQRRPTPRLELGLLATTYASAAIDVSDGLGGDLTHLCEASRCGATVDPLSLPLHESVAPAPTKAPADAKGAHAVAAHFALEGGEDYELLIAVPPKRRAAFERACAKAGHTVTAIGTLTRGSDVTTTDGAWMPRGFDHLGR